MPSGCGFLIVSQETRGLTAHGSHKDRRSNNCRIVADAASIRTDAGSVGHDSDCCADPKTSHSSPRQI